MAQLDSLKRIIADDFKKEDKETVEKLASILNFHMDQVHTAFDGRISFANMNHEVVKITVIVDASGNPIKSITSPDLDNNPIFITQRVTQAIGSTVINAQNLTSSSVYPTGAPYISFSITNEKTYKINNIKGLPANNKFTLTVVMYGN